jgi:deferrochelatase/peroxidase EfeB
VSTAAKLRRTGSELKTEREGRRKTRAHTRHNTANEHQNNITKEHQSPFIFTARIPRVNHA